MANNSNCNETELMADTVGNGVPSLTLEHTDGCSAWGRSYSVTPNTVQSK